LRPGHYLIYDPCQDAVRIRPWWDLDQQAGERITEDRQAVQQFIELLEDAVRLRLQADAPVTLFLAGGLDSSLVASLSGVKQAFTCQFEEFRNTINEEAYVA